MGSLQRVIVKGVMGVVTHPKITLIICFSFLIACAIYAKTHLAISTDQNKLLSSHLKFFGDYLNFVKEFPENEAIYVVLEPADFQHPPPTGRWIALADRITEKLRQMPRDVKSVDEKIPLDQLGSQGLLFDDWPDVRRQAQAAKDFAPLLTLFGANAGQDDSASATPPIQHFLTGMTLQLQTPPACLAVSGLHSITDDELRFATLLAQSWNVALDHPIDQWAAVPGKEIPDLQSLDSYAPNATPDRLGYSYIPDAGNPRSHLLLISVYQNRDYGSLQQIAGPLEHMRSAVVKITAGFPDFHVVLTGRPALEADEMTISESDTTHAEIFAGITVFLALIVMLRSVWLALAAEISLGVAVGWTFGYATLAVGEINLLSTVFVIALIGIGMDYLIQILTRYRQEMQRYERHKAVWVRVFRYVSPPISTACLGAAGAFFAALLTQFRGAAELGVVAGGGLLLCLLAGYTVLPALLVLWPLKVKSVAADERYAEAHIPRSRWARLISPAIWVALVLGLLGFLGKARFNANLLDLQAKNLPSVQMLRKLPTWYAVVMTKDLSQLEDINNALVSASKSPASTIENTSSIADAMAKQKYLAAATQSIQQMQWMPPSAPRAADLPLLAQSATALSRAAENRKIAQNAADFTPLQAALADFSQKILSANHPDEQASRLAQWQVRFAAELKSAAAYLTPGPLNMRQLPDQLRRHYRSDDGTYALYIYPRENDLSDPAKLAAFTRELERIVPENPGVTGIAVQFYHSAEAIRKSFLRATAYALALIFILVLIDLRNISQTLLAVSVLALGLPLLLELMGLLKIDWNFANFFGLPILIGAGHEYGVFMVHRYREVLHNPRRVWRWWDVSDKALLLCAFVTCSSFGYMTMAHHQGLKSLGQVMALGCGCIYLATVMVVRPLLVWRLAGKAGQNKNKAK